MVREGGGRGARGLVDQGERRWRSFQGWEGGGGGGVIELWGGDTPAAKRDAVLCVCFFHQLETVSELSFPSLMTVVVGRGGKRIKASVCLWHTSIIRGTGGVSAVVGGWMVLVFTLLHMTPEGGSILQWTFSSAGSKGKVWRFWTYV